MPKRSETFDAVGVVVDWIDACKTRKLDALLDLYDATACVECCEGGRFEGRAAMRDYWHSRLERAVPGAFVIDALMPVEDGVSVDYRGYDGATVRTRFQFTSEGKISKTTCVPVRLAA
jgi:hypothetical protein